MKLILIVLCSFLLISAAGMQAQNTSDSLHDLEPITHENASRLERLKVFGRGTINTVAWSPNGTQIAVSGSAGVWVYQADDLTAEPIWLDQHRSYVHTLTYHPNGELLFTAGNDSRLRVYDTVTYHEIDDYCFPAYSSDYLPDCSTIMGMGVSQDGELLAIALNDHIVIWDVQTRETVYRLFDVNVHHVAFAVDDTMLVSTSMGWDNTVRFWDLTALSETELNQEPIILETNLPFGIWDMQVSDDSGFAIIAGFDLVHTGIAVIDIPTQDIIAVQPSIGNTASFVSNTVAAGAILSFNDGDTATYSVALADWMTGEQEITIETGSTAAADIALSPDRNRIAIGTINGDLIIYELLRGTTTSSNTGLGYYMWDIEFSDDGQSLAIISGNQIMVPTLAGGGAGGGDRIYLWDFENDLYQDSERQVNELRQMRVIRAGHDGEFFVSGDQMYSISIWKPETGFRSFLEFPIDYSRVFDFELSPDMQTGVISLAGSTSKAVGIIQMDGDNLDISYYGTEVNNDRFYKYYDVAIHPDGSMFGASANDGQVYVWETGTSNALRLNTNYNSVSDIAFSPNGEWVAISGYNSMGWDSITLFDTDEFLPKLILNSEDLALEHLIFNRESDLIIASSIQGDLVLWPVKSEASPVIFHAHSTNITGIAINRQGTLIATSSRDGTVQMWGVPIG